jgi:hypothetical protein
MLDDFSPTSDCNHPFCYFSRSFGKHIQILFSYVLDQYTVSTSILMHVVTHYNGVIKRLSTRTSTCPSTTDDEHGRTQHAVPV